MANYTVAASTLAAQDKTLTANTVDTVTFTDAATAVEVLTDGTAKVYFTVDGTAPTVGGANCYEIPAIASALQVKMPNPSAAVVKLISAGAPVYSVTNAS